jgi:hypothetical protein
VRTSIRILLVAAIGFTTLALLGASAQAAAPCPSNVVAGHLDYVDDVWNKATQREEAGHPNYDVLETRSCMDGANIVLGARVGGTIVTDAAKANYTFVLVGPETLHVSFSNHSAGYKDVNFHWTNAVNTTEGSWLTIWVPNAQYGSRTSGWDLEIEATENTDLTGSDELIDWDTLDTSEEYTDSEDISLETSPFSSPTAAVTKVNVTQTGSTYRVVAEGTTTGAVAELRVTMGVRLTGLGGSTWEYSDYYVEQTMAGGDITVALEKVNGSWAQWKFTRDYTAEGLKGILGNLLTIHEGKIEVRVIAEDGKWGHGSQTFQPTTVGSGTGAGGGGGAGVLIGVGVLLALVAVVALVIMMKRKKAAAAPPVAPGVAPGTAPLPPVGAPLAPPPPPGVPPAFGMQPPPPPPPK